MRKHPLIALTAFTALTASAIAGASTGTFESSSVLTSARTHHEPSSSAALHTPGAAYGADLAFNVALVGPDMSLVHDPSRPSGLHMSSITGLPVTTRHAHHGGPTVVEAVSDLPVAPVPAPVVTTTTSAPAASTSPVTSPSTSPAGGVWYELRLCESGDNYGADTGNGYYGAYQFSLATWYGLGFSGLPSDAPPATQDLAAQELEAEAGWGQWPGCAAELGL